MKRGVFVGLVTLDLIYQTAQMPGRNQKQVASDYLISAGGPAANAAVAFSGLGNQATVMGVVGKHPIAHLIQADLSTCGVTILDLDPQRSDPPPISSILVTEGTGDRSVISINAVQSQATVEQMPSDCLAEIDLVLIDGHQIEVGRTIAQRARERDIPVVMDGGSWKAGFETILPWVDYAICSANFYPPHCEREQDVIAYLSNLGIAHIAITHGEKPIVYQTGAQTGEIDVPPVQAIDTLGAGDIFHGAFCHAILQNDFVTALALAAQVAALSCQFFGARRWLTEL